MDGISKRKIYRKNRQERNVRYKKNYPFTKIAPEILSVHKIFLSLIH